MAIDFPLAGIGSRFIAVLVDMLIWGAGLLLLALLLWVIQPALQAFSRLSYQWLVALVTLVVFVLNWGYFTLFEALWNGQTPGKRVARIRVIERSGRPIGLLESMARNLVRYIDQIPFFYAVGVIAVFASRQHQRLGDLAAGTLVVRDRGPELDDPAPSRARTYLFEMQGPQSSRLEPHALVALPAAKVARLGPGDLEVLEGFLARRLDIPLGTRQVLATRLARAIQAKSGLEVPEGTTEETFLEAVARDLRDVARLR